MLFASLLLSTVPVALSSPASAAANALMAAGGYHEVVDDVPVDPKSCHAIDPNPSERLDLKQFCENDKCWPALWLLGAQKAATSAIYEVLEQCGSVVGAWPSKEMTGSVVPSFCTQPCKETHFFTDPFTWGGGHNGAFSIAKNVTVFPRGMMPADRVNAFTALYQPKQCGARKYEYSVERSRASCESARFIESTPSTDYPNMPKLLASAMPEHLLIRARFVLILREPVERTLSWYNHNRCPYEKANGAPWDPCADEKTSRTFEDFIKCREQTHPLVAQGDAGNYGEFLDHLLETSVGRKQVLIFNYASAFANATQVQATMRAITRHYGGQVLDRVFEVPPSNAKEYPGKVAQISCAARNRLAHTYAPMQERLYQRLDAGAESKNVWDQPPVYEPRFERFALTVPCGEVELSEAQMPPRRKH